MYLHEVGNADDARDWRDVADKIVSEFFVERRVDRRRGIDQEEGVAVRGRAYDRFRGDGVIRARDVFDDEWLTKPLGKPSPQHTRENIRRTAGRRTDDDAHRPRRVGLRPRDARHGRQRGSARGQMQKLSAGKFHNGLLSLVHWRMTSGASRSTIRNQL